MPTSAAPSRSSGARSGWRAQLAAGGAGVPSSRRLLGWARAAGPGLSEVTVRVVGAAEGRRLNRRYRGKDRATNVLSFSYSRSSGDVVLCHPVVAREARVQRKALVAHYAHLVVHGVLHLRGYDHETPDEARRMERAEARILGRLGFADPYALE